MAQSTLNTKIMLNELLGIKYPIIQGAMANIATAKFAATVSNCGGLGVIGTGGMPLEVARQAIRDCKAMTDQPFGVNVMMMHPQTKELMEMIAEEKVAIVTTGAGNPGPYMEMLKASGAKVFPIVANVALAKRLERIGADALIVEGCEAGGHVGETTTMALVPQVIDAVDIPVIAAGGIGDGRGINAAFSLGAIGVQVGTCLLTTEECEIHEAYKEAVINAKDSSTVVTGRSLNAPVRILKNDMSRKYLELEKQAANREELEKLTFGALRKAVFQGDVKNGSVMMGQIAGLCHAIDPMEKRLHDLMEDAKTQYLSLQKTMEKLYGI